MSKIANSSNSTALALDEKELLQVLESSLYPGASHSSIKMVIGYCKAAGLDPMQKPVHIVPMWDGKNQTMRDVIMPGIGLYRTQAARSAECAGVSEPEFGQDITEAIGGQQITYPAWCRVTVKRRLPTGEVVDFTAKEFWKENYAVKGGKDKSVAPNAMWSKRPYGQIAKCAEAQALRKAFPEVGSAPTADEMEGKDLYDNQSKIIDPAPRQRETWTAEAFEAILPKLLAGIQKGKSVEDALAWLRAKADLTDMQEAALRAAAAPTDVNPATGEIIIPAAEIEARLLSCKDLDTLYLAADLINSLPEADAERLSTVFSKREAELKGAA